MKERVIIPENSGFRLVFNYEKTRIEDESGVGPSFNYDADFIDEVLKDGYVKAAMKMKSPASVPDEKKTDMLAKDLYNQWLGWGDEYLTETTRFVKSSDRAPHVPGELSGGRIPVSDELWRGAKMVIRSLNILLLDLPRRFGADGDDAPFSEPVFDAPPYCFWVNVESISRTGGKPEILLTLPLARDGGMFTRRITMADHYELLHDFQFRYDPSSGAVSDAWMMQSYINSFKSGSFGTMAFYLCKGLGEPFREMPVGGNIQSIEARIMRGLIRIQNHLNNPGMSDEEYLDLLNR